MGLSDTDTPRRHGVSPSTQMETPIDVLLEEILIDESPRVRIEDNEDAIHDYRDSYRRNDKLPPPLIYQVERVGLLVADGRHRLIAAREAGLERLPCWVRQGTKEQCLVAALGANTRHGLRRTNADKRMCVEKALRQWPNLSDRQIADAVHVGADLVATVRGVLVCRGHLIETPERTGGDGKTRTIATAKPPAENLGKVKTMTAKKDPHGEIIHTEPVPVPKGLNATTVPRILHVAKVLEDLWEAHPTWHIPAFRTALAELRVIREDLQLEFPGFGESRARRETFKPPSLDTVREWCRRDGIPITHADEFHSFYESKGWKVGKNPMVSAEAAFARSKGWNSANGKGRVAAAMPTEKTISQKSAAKIAAKVGKL